ncbi:uncharacterized protein K441DRAFT_693517 [Cenococcum geophilum 1.58]|uniref:uncharacterized protein n=1 Tax=Cenococcum geophilum 1.58 TaxID=794803 RepID=UPI00358EF4AA|nr:hypothetical protein K441DRAFT_693517 [Cenococcum geophilum 1.58]
MPPTVYQSFYRSLPDLQLDKAEYYQIGPSGHTTSTTDPLKTWEPAPISYAQKADDILKKLASSLRSPLPAIERPFLMITEGDVLRATTLYVVHPINQALNAKYRNTPIYCLAENFREGIRCDITWKYRNGEDLDTIAVLELKRRGVLRWDDFECAESNATTRKDKIQEAYGKVGSNGAATTLKGNAITLSQQASAYAIRQETQFIGLFDWDSMFLFQFCGLDPDAEEIGDWAYGTWVEDKEPNVFRKTLFGFLVAACEAKIET